MKRQFSEWLPWIGSAITIAYVVFLAFAFGPWSEFWTFITTEEYNQRGDFLAGVFGPVAFLWLIIGYFMQSRELRLQREELSMQRDIGERTSTGVNELVQQQKAATEPVIEFQFVGRRGPAHNHEVRYRFTNNGGTAKDFKVWIKAGRLITERKSFEAGLPMKVEFDVDAVEGGTVQLNVTYTTVAREGRQQEIQIDGHGTDSPTIRVGPVNRISDAH